MEDQKFLKQLIATFKKLGLEVELVDTTYTTTMEEVTFGFPSKSQADTASTFFSQKIWDWVEVKKEGELWTVRAAICIGASTFKSAKAV